MISVSDGEKFGLKYVDTQEEAIMPGSQHELSRNGFVKVITAMVGTAIGAMIGIPAIGYLISPATKNRSHPISAQKKRARQCLLKAQSSPFALVVVPSTR